MSRFIQFYGYKTPYDEEQSRERYLAVLKSRARVSALKESAERDISQGVVPTQKVDKTTSEILADEAELQKQVLTILGTLLQRADIRKQAVNEPDDLYQQRINPTMYVYRQLSPEQQRLLITQIEGIKKDLGGAIGKILPEDFLIFLNAYQTSFQESGGVSSFNRTNIILERLRGLQEDIAQTPQILSIKSILDKIRKDIQSDIAVGKQDKQDLAKQIEYINKKLDLIKKATQIDISKVGEKEIKGEEDVLNNYDPKTGQLSLNAESRTERLAQEVEKNVPTKQSLDDINEMLTEYKSIGSTKGLGVDSAYNILERTSEIVAPITEKNVLNMERIASGKPSIREIEQEELSFIPVSQRVAEIENRTFKSLPETKEFKSILKSVRNEFRARGMYLTNPTFETRNQMETEALKRYEALQEQLSEQPTITKAFASQPKSRRLPEDVEIIEEELPMEGIGLKAKIAKTKQVPRFMVGRGLALPEKQIKYAEFGKYAISIPQLQKGILTTRYANSGNPIIHFPSLKITPDFADFIESFIETEYLDEKRLSKLPDDEKKLFAKLINGSGLYGKYKVKAVKTKEEDEEEKRFHLVKGMFIAGNDNPQIIKELKQLLIKFMSDGRISRSQGQDLLLQLTL